MSLRLILPLCLALSLPSLARAGMSEVSCDDTARMLRTLQTTLRAERLGAGLRDPETLLEVWVTPESGDWVIVQNYANGTSCIVAMGEHWQAPAPGPA